MKPIRRALSSEVVGRGGRRSGSQITPPCPPRLELTMPARCRMSATGLNCGLPPLEQPDEADMPVGAPCASTHGGSVKRLISTGTASFKSACLSAISSTELSIMNNRSTLSALVTTEVQWAAIEGRPAAPAARAGDTTGASPAALPPTEPPPMPTLDSPASDSVPGGCECVCSCPSSRVADPMTSNDPSTHTPAKASDLITHVPLIARCALRKSVHRGSRCTSVSSSGRLQTVRSRRRRRPAARFPAL